MGVAFISDMLLVCCAQMPGETAVQIISGCREELPRNFVKLVALIER